MVVMVLPIVQKVTVGAVTFRTVRRRRRKTVGSGRRRRSSSRLASDSNSHRHNLELANIVRWLGRPHSRLYCCFSARQSEECNNNKNNNKRVPSAPVCLSVCTRERERENNRRAAQTKRMRRRRMGPKWPAKCKQWRRGCRRRTREIVLLLVSSYFNYSRSRLGRQWQQEERVVVGSVGFLNIFAPIWMRMLLLLMPSALN